MDERRWTRDDGRGTKAQVLIEFTFCMIVIFLMIYAAMMIFFWTGSDLSERRAAHDAALTMGNIVTDYDLTTLRNSPLKQIDSYFYRPGRMNAVWDGN